MPRHPGRADAGAQRPGAWRDLVSSTRFILQLSPFQLGCIGDTRWATALAADKVAASRPGRRYQMRGAQLPAARAGRLSFEDAALCALLYLSDWQGRQARGEARPGGSPIVR